MGILSNNKIKHSKAVAEFLYNNTRFVDKREDMYILGLLHDIGYLRVCQGHAVEGGNILKELNFPYWKAVSEHGNPNTTPSQYTDELNWADMQINSEGELVGFDSRLNDIKVRYGEKSKQYIDACRIVNKLKENGFKDIGKI